MVVSSHQPKSSKVSSSSSIPSDDGQKSLLTSKALSTSLSAPRVPPFGSAHRELLLCRNPYPSPWVELPFSQQQQQQRQQHNYHNHHPGHNRGKEWEAHSQRSHATLRQRLRDRLIQRSHFDNPHSSSQRHLHRLPHPHLATGPELSDQITRFLGVLLPLKWQNACRDSGFFRAICNAVAMCVAPSMLVASPSSLQTFLKLSSRQRMRRIRYGPHALQVVDVFLAGSTSNSNPTVPSASSSSHETVCSVSPSRLIFFVHGGAWGSGQSWMYRLVAAPFLAQGWSVAIPGYRTYPDGTAVDQAADCERAARRLAVEYPSLCSSQVTVMGHSSGAHIALLMMVQWAEQQSSHGGERAPGFPVFDSFVGLSGPYDISHHFDYEASRGVEEISPMKPSCGYSREGFCHYSPALRLQAALTRRNEATELLSFFPPTVLVHGIEDVTVPFTSSAEAARVLRSCGVIECQEIYVAETGHEDTVVQLMLGGRTQSAVTEWIRNLEKESSSSSLSPQSTPPSPPPDSSKTLILAQRSRL